MYSEFSSYTYSMYMKHREKFGFVKIKLIHSLKNVVGNNEEKYGRMFPIT